VSVRNERGVSIALGFGALAATAKAGQYAVSAYKEWKEQQQQQSLDQVSNPEEPNMKSSSSSSTSTGDKTDADNKDGQQQGQQQQQRQQQQQTPRENVFARFFNVGSNYYEGGFEEKMTKSEAALILGVRPSSTEKRIKEAHRKLLILNHPDTGGSTYLSGKINEAKDLLLKNKAK
jgi:hypothetical protein